MILKSPKNWNTMDAFAARLHCSAYRSLSLSAPRRTVCAPQRARARLGLVVPRRTESGARRAVAAAAMGSATTRAAGLYG